MGGSIVEADVRLHLNDASSPAPCQPGERITDQSGTQQGTRGREGVPGQNLAREGARDDAGCRLRSSVWGVVGHPIS